MSELLAKYAAVYGLATVKPVLAPALAYVSGLSMVESVVLSALGIVSSVLVLSTVGGRVRAYFVARRRRLGKPEVTKEVSPRVRAIWDRYGMAGVAFITPLLLSPPGGAIAATALGVPRPRILLHIAWAAVFWSAVYSGLVYLGGDAFSFMRG